MKSRLLLILFLCLSASIFSQNLLDQLRPAGYNTKNLFEKSRINYYINSSHINETDVEGLLRRGIANMQMSLYDTAIKYFRKLIPKGVDNFTNTESMNRFPQPYYFIGLCKVMKKQRDSAEYYLRKATRIDPLYSEAWTELGSLMMSNGDFDNALNYLDKAHEINPTSIQVCYNLGLLWDKKGREAKAIGYLKDAVKINPDFDLAYTLMGYIRLKDNKTYAARKFFKMATEVNPDAYLAYYFAGLAYLKDIKLKKAYESMLKAYSIDSSNYEILGRIASIDIFQGRYKAGVDNLLLANDLIQKEENYAAVSGYAQLEFIEILKNLQSRAGLSQEEIELAYEYINYYSKAWPGAAKRVVDEFIEENPATMFVKRLQLLAYYHYYRGSSREHVSLEYAEKLLEADSTQVNARMLKAMLLYAEGKNFEARQSLKEVIKYKPDYALAYYYLGRLANYMQDPGSAETYLDKAIKYFPDFYEAYTLRAFIMISNNREREAIKNYFKALSINPGNSDLTNNIACCYRDLGLPDSALYFYNLSVQLNSNSASVYNNRGKLYYMKGDTNKAFRDFKKAININSKYADAFNKLGEIFFNASQLDSAFIYYTHALKLEPNNRVFLVDRGEVFYAMNDYEKAMLDFEVACDIDRTDALTNKNLGDCYRHQEEYRKAINQYMLALNYNRFNRDTPHCIGLCYESLQKYDSAIFFLNLAIRIDSNYASPYGEIGWIYYLKGDYEKSITYSSKNLELEEDALFALYHIPLATLRMGDVKRAKELYREAVKKNMALDKKIYDQAIDELEELITNNIMKEEAEEILHEIMQAKKNP